MRKRLLGPMPLVINLVFGLISLTAISIIFSIIEISSTTFGRYFSIMVLFYMVFIVAVASVGHGLLRWPILWYTWLSTDLMAIRILDFKGNMSYTVAIKSDNSMIASVYWAYNVGEINLDPNGLISTNSPTIYILWWEPIRQNELIEHKLRRSSDFPNFDKISNMKTTLVSENLLIKYPNNLFTHY
jgi:hypothetical protein